jgi:hypothetical protein
MSSDPQDRLKQLLIRWVLVVAPTILIGYITLRFVNFSYTAFNTGLFGQTLYFGAGILLAYSLYYFGARWIITFLILLVVYGAVERSINRLPGEFDVFYTMARFELYSTLFIFGWVFGFMLARLRWSSLIIFGMLTAATLVAISNTIDITISYAVLHLLPVVVYGLYMLFLAPLVAGPVEWKKSGRLAWRIVLFALLILLAFFLSANLFKGNLTAVEKELAARGAKGKKDASGNGSQGDYDERNGLMEKGKGDDGYRLKDTMRVNSKMSQSDKLMFCSKLDNYFPDGSPAPLYFVYHYLTRYDPVKQSFTRDVNVPSLDEFDVDPVRLPMYYSITDTSIIRKSMARKFRKVVEAQVYLSENTWKHSVLAPANAFSIQTIPVEKDFKKTFLSAYKIISFASELNNAYFVYNISVNPGLEAIQEKRVEELRTVQNYKAIDKKFIDYYTVYPSGAIYDSIAKLARSLSSMNSRPVDKVIAVRDYFLKRNDAGKRVFRYTMQAGAVDDPNIPSSKMLYDFLFKTHAGYCTYYAGASLFMLRALGVPARFTTGFATINRSDKNKGWYWFYASQAHAWTQVYFPEYGWLDFDMTIGNEDQQGAPKPDGTPPLPPPEPWLVLNAKAEAVDPKTKKLTVTFDQMIYLNTPYQLRHSFTEPVDASLCRVLYNERDTVFSVVHPGDSVLIISYKDDAKKIPQPRPGISIEDQVAGFPVPVIADEIHIRKPEKEKKKQEASKKTEPVNKNRVTWQQLALWAAVLLGGALLLLLIFPLLYLAYRMIRMALARDRVTRADEVYRAALYRFHMAGFEREANTPLDYARTRIDPAVHAGFETFMILYLRLKYSGAAAQPEDDEIIRRFAAQIGPGLRKKNGILRTLIHYFNIPRALRYFQQPLTTDYETENLPL